MLPWGISPVIERTFMSSSRPRFLASKPFLDDPETFLKEIRKSVRRCVKRSQGLRTDVDDTTDDLVAIVMCLLCEKNPATEEEAVKEATLCMDRWRKNTARRDERLTDSLDEKVKWADGEGLSRFEVMERRDARSRYREPNGEAERVTRKLAEGLISGKIKAIAWVVCLMRTRWTLDYDEIAKRLRISEGDARQMVSRVSAVLRKDSLKPESAILKKAKAIASNHPAHSQNPVPGSFEPDSYFIEEVGICQNSAVRQLCVSHPKHDEYLRHAARSRFFQKNPKCLLHDAFQKNLIVEKAAA
jgi:hypothetical protein